MVVVIVIVEIVVTTVVVIMVVMKIVVMCEYLSKMAMLMIIIKAGKSCRLT